MYATAPAPARPRRNTVLRIRRYPLDAALSAIAALVIADGAINPWGYVFGEDSTLGAPDLGARPWMLTMVLGGALVAGLAVVARDRAFLGLVPLGAIAVIAITTASGRVAATAAALYPDTMTGSAGGAGITIVAYGLLLAVVAIVAGVWRTLSERGAR